MTVETYATTEELLASMTSAREAADESIQPWQRELKPGDKVVRLYGDLVIFGQLLDVLELERQEYDLDDPEEAAQCAEMARFYSPSGDWYQSFRFGKFYSVACTEGELGDVHLATVAAKITEGTYELARVGGWVIP